MNLFEKLIPRETLSVKNIKSEYFLNIFHNAFFCEGNWLLYYLTIISYRTVGYIDAISIGLGLLLEIPTGAIADLIGRKKTVVFASLFISIGIYIQGFALDQWALLIGNLLFFTGMSFYSGANDALTYDSFKEENKAELYEDFVFRSKITTTASYILAVLIGGFVYQFNPRLPFIIWGSTHFLGFLTSLTLTEPKVEHYVFSFKNYIKQNIQGFRELFKPELRKFIFFIFSILGISYIFEWGLLKPSIGISFGFGAVEMSYLFTIEAIISAFIYYNFRSIRRKSGDYLGLVLLNFILIICFFLFSQEIGFWGAIPMLLISMVGSLANPWLVIIINKYTLSEFRATTLSTVAMILKIPYVLTIGYIGNLIDDGFLRGTLLSIAFVLLIIAVVETATTVGLKIKHKKATNDQ